MTCRHDVLESLAYGRLFGATEQVVRAHARQCDHCRTRLGRFEREARAFALLDRLEEAAANHPARMRDALVFGDDFDDLPSFDRIVARARPNLLSRARRALDASLQRVRALKWQPLRTMPLQRLVPAFVAGAAAMAIYSSDVAAPQTIPGGGTSYAAAEDLASDFHPDRADAMSTSYQAEALAANDEALRFDPVELEGFACVASPQMSPDPRDAASIDKRREVDLVDSPTAADEGLACVAPAMTCDQ